VKFIHKKAESESQEPVVTITQLALASNYHGYLKSGHGWLGPENDLPIPRYRI
jgi:hypothetical protein